MPLVHLRRTSRGLRPIIAAVSSRGHGLAGLAQLRATSAAAVDAEEQGKKDQSATTDTDANHQFLVLADPAHRR